MVGRPLKDQQTLPAIYAAHLVQLVARWGVTPERLLSGTELAAVDLSQPDARIGHTGMSALIERAVELTREPGLSFYYGLHLKLTSHGVVGLAAMTSATLREALAVAERFFPLRMPAIQFSHRVERDQVIIELVETMVLGDLRVFLLESLMTCLAQLGKTLLGHPVHGVFEVTFPESTYHQGFAHLLPGPVRFRQPANRMLFPASSLDEPLQMADALASQQALEQCERELAMLGETSTLLAGVRRQMMARKAGFPSLTELADLRHVSTRTLKRNLEAHGTSYQALLDELRRDRALALLEDTGLTIDRVAELLGYSDPSNFNRAFRRWMGVAPSVWREAHARAG